jgi:Tol biopolymer transport system component
MKSIAKHSVVFVFITAAAVACDPSAFKFPNIGGSGGNTTSAASGGGKVVSAMPTEDQEIVVNQVTSLAESASAPALSPDGAILLFLKADGVDPKTKKKIFSLMGTDANGSAAPAEYTQDGVSALDPTFFPDASGYAFVTDSMGAVGIVRTESVKAGASASMVAQGFTEPHSPSVAPDAGRIMFSAKLKGQDMVITVKPDGTMKSVLGPGRKPRYSPDGQKAVFVRPGKNSHAQIFTMSAANGKGVTQVLAGEAEDDSPSFSPDGQYISFVSSRSATDATTRNVFIVRADGTGLKQITRGSGAISDAYWGKDGRIYFSADPERVGHTNIFVASMPKVMGSFIGEATPEPQQAQAPQHAPQRSAPTAQNTNGGGGWLRSLIPGGQAQAAAPVPAPAEAPQQSVCSTGSTCATGAEECPNLPCRCNNGRIVNTRACNNACCAPANVACTNSCAKHGGYSGNLSGGTSAAQEPSQPAPASRPSEETQQRASKIGDVCTDDNQCPGNAICTFRKGANGKGICYKKCNDPSFDCSLSEKCCVLGNTPAQVCIPESLAGSSRSCKD